MSIKEQIQHQSFRGTYAVVKSDLVGGCCLLMVAVVAEKYLAALKLLDEETS